MGYSFNTVVELGVEGLGSKRFDSVEEAQTFARNELHPEDKITLSIIETRTSGWVSASEFIKPPPTMIDPRG